MSFMRCVNRIARCGVFYRDEAVAPYGLNGHQPVYLLNVCNHPGITQEQLANKILINKSNVARQAAALEQGGFITRRPDENDKRQLRLYPTENALALAPALREVLQGWNALLLEDLSQQEREQLCALLEKIMDKAVSLVSRQVYEPEERP